MWINCPKDTSPYFGFVYLIENKINGRLYIGKKQFNKYRRGKAYASSDWERYWGSCNELNEDIERFGLHNFSKTILHCHKTRWETTYAELKEQIERNVLQDRVYYNGIIRVRLPAYGKPRRRVPKKGRKAVEVLK